MSRKAFTLIELLVVIAIIALLLGILVPSLSAIKEYASVANCLSNQKSLATAAILYAIDNDDKLFSGYVSSGVGTKDKPSWVKPPLAYDADGTLVYVGDGDRLGHVLNRDARLNGLRAGAIYPYLNSTDVFHCPGDRRAVKGTSNAANYPFLRYTQIYNSYGMPILYGQDDRLRISEIKTGGQSILFVEYQYDRTFNSADWNYNPGARAWHDPLGNYHNESCTFAFVDGHSEHHKWRDKRTIILMSDRDLADDLGFGPKTAQLNPLNPDHDWMDSHFPSK